MRQRWHRSSSSMCYGVVFQPSHYGFRLRDNDGDSFLLYPIRGIDRADQRLQHVSEDVRLSRYCEADSFRAIMGR